MNGWIFGRIASGLAGVWLASAVFGCAAEEGRRSPASLDEEGGKNGGLSESCEPGEVDECSVTLAEHNGVLSCYDGTRTCNAKGKWGKCGTGNVVSLPALPAGAFARQLLTVTEECAGNPCDPTCRAFPDVPDAAGDERLIVRTSPYEWQTGTLSSFPKGLVNKGLKEPCTTGFDCQFNTRCINPITEGCSHDKCSAGEALIAECDPCVEMVCEEYPECCTGYTGACSHDLGEVGEALRSTCSDCTSVICETPGFEYCCDRQNGSWDEACVAEVEPSCGGWVGCCEGEVQYGDSCYSVEESRMNWSNARSSCQERAGWDLVSIASDDENDFVYSLNDDDHTWIGLSSGTSNSSNWNWSSGDPAGSWKESTRSGHPFNAFRSSEPGNSDACARMNADDDGDWDGRGCSSNYESICEGPPTCSGGTPPVEEPAEACVHDPCQVGVALKSNCDLCVQEVCEANPSCCSSSGAWTSSCVAAIASECSGISTCTCAAGEESYGGHCYKLHTASASWTSAISTCRNTSGWDLVSIGSSQENTFIRQLNGSNDTWIGFTESSTYGGKSNGNSNNHRWVWTNGDPSGYWQENGSGSVTYHPWVSGEPDASGNCARMKANTNGEWGDSSCSTSYDFICEGPAGTVLSPLTPVPVVSTTPAGPYYSQESSGDGGDVGEWTEACVDRVASMCDAQCGIPDEQGSGICVPWYPSQTDPSCSGIDLAVSVPCSGSIPVCNHGNSTAPAGIRLVHFPANSGHYPQCEPSLSHPQMYECFTDREIPPGECIDVTSCPQLKGNREIMVNPPGAAHVEECSCQDNWSLFSGGTCGPPVCSGGTNVATMKTRPIDIIVSIDNSKSMQGEIEAIQQRINQDFAEIIQASGVDYRVIMVSRYGNVHQENYNGGSVYTSAFSICVNSPLSTLTCPTSSSAFTPAVAHNAPRFFHHSTDIGSNDMWCKLTGSFSASDPYPSSRSGFTPIATSGWGEYLRDDSFKVFLGITDDSPGTGSGTGVCPTSTGFANTTTGATKFDQAIRQLAPSQFGAYDASKPNEGRNYVWYSIVGMAGNHSKNPTPLEPAEATVTKCCRGDGSSTSSCPGSTGAAEDGAGNGVGYQELSKLTGGLRYPSCYNDNFDEIFQAVAQEVIEGARVSCDFTLQNPGAFDINTAKVYFQESENSNPVQLKRAANLASCTADGWYSPNASTPEIVSLCPSACAKAQENTESRLSVEVGCLGTGYDPYTFTEAYSAECRFDQVPQWGFFAVDSTITADASIVLRARTADSEAGLAEAEYVPLGTLSLANGNSHCTAPDVEGCPMDLYELLDGAPSAHHAFIEVEVTVNPTSDKSTLPTVDEWTFSYSCIDAE